MSEPDFYLGETWIFEGTVQGVRGQALSLNSARIKLRLYTSQGPALTIDSETSQNVQLLEETGHYQIYITPEDQEGFNVAVRDYGCEVHVTLENGQEIVHQQRHIKVEPSSFVRWA